MQWYYLSDAQEQVPVEEQELPAFIQAGTISQGTMVWHEGMPDWMPCGEVLSGHFGAPAAPAPEMAAAGPAPAPDIQAQWEVFDHLDHALVREFGQIIARKSVWMKIVAIGLIIQALTAVVRFFTLTTASRWLFSDIGLSVSLFLLGLCVVYPTLAVLLFRTASGAKRSAAAGNKQYLLRSLGSMSIFFRLAGIFAAIGLCLLIVIVAISLAYANSRMLQASL